MIGLFIEEQIPRGHDAWRRRSPRSAARAAWCTCRTRSTAALGPRLRAPARRSSTTSTRSRCSTRAWRSARSTRRRRGSPPSTGSSAGAGSDSHVAAGSRLGPHPHARLRRPGGVPAVAARRRDRPRPTSLLYVQALKFLQTRATPPSARRAQPGAPSQARDAADRRRGARWRRPASGAQVRCTPRTSIAAVKSLGVDARDRRRDPREVPGARHPRAEHAHARAAVLPALPARQPDAGARLGPPAGRRVAAQVRAPSRRRSRRASPSTVAPAAR